MTESTDVERIANEVLTRLDKIGDWMQGSGTEVLAIYTKMALWDSGGFFLGGLTLTLFACVPLWFARMSWKNRDKANNEAGFVPLTLLAFVLTGLGATIAYGGVMRLAIPEYFAIQMLLQQVL